MSVFKTKIAKALPAVPSGIQAKLADSDSDEEVKELERVSLSIRWIDVASAVYRVCLVAHLIPLNSA